MRRVRARIADLEVEFTDREAALRQMEALADRGAYRGGGRHGLRRNKDGSGIDFRIDHAFPSNQTRDSHPGREETEKGV